MWRRIAGLTAALILSACQSGNVRVLIGGTAIAAPGALPIEDSVIVIVGNRIRSVGMRKDIPIPQDSQRTNLSGKWIVPADGGRLAPGEPADYRILDRAP